MAEIRLECATLGYGRRAIIENLSFTVPAGDFMLIGGPNGAGKSTLLKSLVGLLPLLGGKRCVDGASIGYVPQQANAESALPITALELVEMGASSRLRMLRTFWRMEREFYMECLCECQAADLARRAFSELSGGQRQRVLLARALAVRPNVLVLDEPTAGVDHATQEIIAQLLGRLNGEKSVSVILVTHEPEAFAGVRHRTAVVSNGVVTVR